jgi:hypothetical protein
VKTLDRRVHGVLTGEWGLNPVEGDLPLLTKQVILEFKFREVADAQGTDSSFSSCFEKGLT